MIAPPAGGRTEQSRKKLRLWLICGKKRESSVPENVKWLPGKSGPALRPGFTIPASLSGAAKQSPTEVIYHLQGQYKAWLTAEQNIKL